MMDRLERRLRGRLLAALNVLRGRPTMYRMRTGPLTFGSMRNVHVIECQIIDPTPMPDRGSRITYVIPRP